MLATIHTQRTIISPLEEKDFEEILKMYHEPDSAKFIPPLLNKTNQEYLDFLTIKINTNDTPKGLGFWTIRRKEDLSFLGTANLNFMETLQFIHMGCQLSKSIWGQGYGTEIMTAMKNHGLNDLKIPTIYGILSKEHIASKKMLMKAGLVYEKLIELRGDAVEVYKTITEEN